MVVAVPIGNFRRDVVRLTCRHIQTANEALNKRGFIPRIRPCPWIAGWMGVNVVAAQSMHASTYFHASHVVHKILYSDGYGPSPAVVRAYADAHASLLMDLCWQP